MKNYEKVFLILLVYFEFLSKIQIIKSSEIEEVGKHIVMSFRKEVNNDVANLSPDKYMEELMYKQYFAKYNIGNPTQKIKFYYDMNVFESSISEDYYEKIRSSTYKCLDNKKCPNKKTEINDFNLTDKNGYLSQEIFELNPDNKIENFTFLLKPKGKTDSEQNEIPNLLGFGLSNNNKDKDVVLLSFMEQLKRYNYIEKKLFTILTGDNSIIESRFYDGYILIGCLPHEVNPLFEEKDLKWISNKVEDKSNRNWHINFDTVKYNNEVIKERTANLDLSLNIIIGPESFRQKLLKGFFKKDLENKNCVENLFYNLKDEEHYIYYSCGYEASFIDIPNLSFYSKSLNETFELSFEKLFTTFKHRHYFNIVFNKKTQNSWTLGQIFLNNYRFVFDAEKERIGYYKTIIPENHPFIALISIAIAFIIFFILYLSGNKFTVGQDNIYNNQQLQKNLHQPVREEYSNLKNKNNAIGNRKNKLNDKKSKKD